MTPGRFISLGMMQRTKWGVVLPSVVMRLLRDCLWRCAMVTNWLPFPLRSPAEQVKGGGGGGGGGEGGRKGREEDMRREGMEWNE